MSLATFWNEEGNWVSAVVSVLAGGGTGVPTANILPAQSVSYYSSPRIEVEVEEVARASEQMAYANGQWYYSHRSATVRVDVTTNRYGEVVTALTWLLFLFFCGFNVLEASQPSLTSRVAPRHARGAALGVFNTLQSLGFFAGGAAGGWLVRQHGAGAVFLACAILMLLWLLLAWPMRAPGRWAVPPSGTVDRQAAS